MQIIYSTNKYSNLNKICWQLKQFCWYCQTSLWTQNNRKFAKFALQILLPYIALRRKEKKDGCDQRNRLTPLQKQVTKYQCWVCLSGVLYPSNHEHRKSMPFGGDSSLTILLIEKIQTEFYTLFGMVEIVDSNLY